MVFPFLNPPPAIGCGDPGDPTDFSVFMDGNAHFSRTFASGGNRRKCTFHFGKNLVKTSDGTDRVLFNSPQPTTGTNGLSIRIETDRIIIIVDDGSNYWVGKSASLLRDFAGWYSATVTIDTDEPDPENRFILDLDGDRQVLETTAGSMPAQGSNLYLVSGEYSVGRRPTAGFTSKFLGYLARFIYVDGIALPSSAFRYTSLFGHPVNRRYTGAFGANGFHLDFADPIDFGKDVSDNGNHFASFGLTVDNQVTDTPSNNRTTINAVWPHAGNLSEGNTVFSSSSTYNLTPLSFFAREGKYWLEFKSTGYGPIIGVCPASDMPKGSVLNGAFGYYGRTTSYDGGWLYGNGGVIQSGGVAYYDDNVINIGLDLDNLQAHLYCDGVLQYTQAITDDLWGFFLGDYISNASPGVRVINDPADMTNPPPKGYLVPSSVGRKCPDILRPEDYVTSRVKLAGADVDDVWDMTVGKSLIMTFNLDTGESRVVDTVRGIGFAWETNTANAEIDNEAGGVTAFTNDGFQVGNAAAYQGRRLDVMWRASPKSGMDIIQIDHVTGTPTTVAQLTGGIVDMCFLIPLDGGDRRWYHRLLPGKYNRLNSSGDPVTDAGGLSSTANTLTIGASVPSGRWMAYPFRAVSQFSAFPTYEGAANVDGAFVPTDFLPRLMLTDDIGTGVNGYPVLIDAALNPNNPGDKLIYPNTADGEVTALWGDFYSNGVKFRAANHPNGGYPYACGLWAQTPGKFARAR